ncbi:hypothetical protein ACI65C_000264 [Semiaphis heraclei]
MAQWQMLETNMDSYIEELYEDEQELTQKEIIQQMYNEISNPNEVNNDILVEEDKELLNESSHSSYSEPCSFTSTLTRKTSNIILKPSPSPTLQPNNSCSAFKAKTPSWFENTKI